VSEVITIQALRALIDESLSRGTRVAGPARVKTDLVAYTTVSAASELLLQGSPRPSNSIKEFVFPRSEKLFGYRLSGNRVDLVDTVEPEPEQIVIAARPCDAAALPILDHVFNWDFRDELFNARRAGTTVVTLACSSFDDSCFCTSVNLRPDSDRGSDVLLFDLGSGTFEVRCVSDKGQHLFKGKTERSESIAAAVPGPERKFDPERIRRFVEENFESPFWRQDTLSCLGCGACAYTCPTCHCFDMVDETNGRDGARVRNWDSCQFALFTLHASGHNPRSTQAQRQRQRVYHKFRIYPEKFGEILCTGCGNCTRHCPAGLGMLGVLSDIGHA